mmetsp:Transcript_30586/g.61666  ORF Transcript_30586/g.61666 Transcript_30586/m.61666 type:complete len:249 (-) Transcript_30586:115-861(-)
MGAELSCCAREKEGRTVVPFSESKSVPPVPGHKKPDALAAPATPANGVPISSAENRIELNGSHSAPTSAPVAAPALASLRFSAEEAAEVLKGEKTSLLRARDAEVEAKRTRNQQLKGRYGFDPYVAIQLSADDRIKHSRALRPPPPKPTTAAGRKAEAEAAAKQADWKAAVTPLSEIAEGMAMSGEMQDGAHFCDVRITKVMKGPLSALPPSTLAQHGTDDVDAGTEMVYVEFELLKTVSTAPLASSN